VEQLFTQNELESLFITEMNCAMASACLEPKMLFLCSVALTLQAFHQGAGAGSSGVSSAPGPGTLKSSTEAAKLLDSHVLAMGKTS